MLCLLAGASACRPAPSGEPIDATPPAIPSATASATVQPSPSATPIPTLTPTPAPTATRTPIPSPTATPEAFRGLRAVAPDRVSAGAAVNAWSGQDWQNPLYLQTFAHAFNLGYTEGPFDLGWVLLPRFDGLLPEPERVTSLYHWFDPDRVVANIQAAGASVRGGVLIDNLQIGTSAIPEWLNLYNAERLERFIPAHIHAIVERYPQVSEWIVVSDLFWGNDKRAEMLLSNFWNAWLGPRYVEIAFRAARQANPRAVLIMNENLTYCQDTQRISGPELDAFYEFVIEQRTAGVPIDGVGFQSHLQAADFLDEANIAAYKADLKAAIERFGAAGVGVYITGLDVNLAHLDGMPKSETEILQGKIYRAAAEACLESAACKSFTLWGFTDASSWLYNPGYPCGEAFAPLVFDEFYHPKPAYDQLLEAFAKR